MTPDHHHEAEQRARAYIDKILRINEKYGMGGAVSAEDYERAVAGCASAYSSLLTASPSPTPGPSGLAEQ
jgi:hypothetical protein